MAETETPRTFGPYLVERELGRGGMGVVYAATNEVFGGRAAVKVLLSDVSRDATLVERFMNEARAASAIDHPSIVKVYDVGTSDDVVYIVMELLQGESLAARLKARGALPLATAIGFARQCANALEAAHKAGIVHRDLKPDNVFLVPDVEVVGGERVKLLDFGVAKLVGGGTAASVARTVTGAILGTPHYMSPEQCEGAREVDARSDLYSLGCMLFQMVSGRLPFQSPGIGGLIGMHLHVAPPPLRSVRPDAPAELEALIGKLLEKDPDVRIQTATDVASALAGLPMIESVAAVAPTRPTPVPVVDALMPTVMTVSGSRSDIPTITTQARAPRRWLWAALAGAIAVAAVVIVIGRRGDDDPPALHTQVRVAAPPVDVAPPRPPPIRGPDQTSGSGETAAPAPPVATSQLDFEIAVGQRMLRERKFTEALDQANVVLAKEPSQVAALQLAKDARHGITELLLSTMRSHLDAKRFGDVKRGREEVHRRSDDPAQRAAADRLWAKAKPQWDAAERARKTAAELERARAEFEMGREMQIKNAFLRIEHVRNYVVVAGCIDLLRIDRTRVPWERCVTAQCEVNPSGMGTLLLNAPPATAQRLKNLCPPSKPPAPKPAPAPAPAP